MNPTDIWLAHIRNRIEKGGTTREEGDCSAGMIAFVALPSQHKCVGGVSENATSS
jgi:hypothetical protein